MTKFTFLGIDDTVTTCDCCGKRKLKCAVALENQDGEVVHYGRDCASRALGWGLDATRAERRARSTMAAALTSNANGLGNALNVRDVRTVKVFDGKLDVRVARSFHPLLGEVELYESTGIRLSASEGWIEVVKEGIYVRKTGADHRAAQAQRDRFWAMANWRAAVSKMSPEDRAAAIASPVRPWL
jgi:hypothetical protein